MYHPRPKPIHMDQEEKKAYILLIAIIFYYHGLDDDEREILAQMAEEQDAQEELKWTFQFIEKDVITSFDRAREYLNKVIGNFSNDRKLHYLKIVWNANNQKGYITEMEATAMLKLAKDWDVENELLAMVRNLSTSTP